jgi:hypothetical protein
MAKKVDVHGGYTVHLLRRELWTPRAEPRGDMTPGQWR